jgi:hypothetical protein
VSSRLGDCLASQPRYRTSLWLLLVKVGIGLRPDGQRN